jgi:hypothetical protein
VKDMQDITALSLWQKGLKHNYVTANEVENAQKVYKDESANDILLRVYEAHLKQCTDDLERLGLLTDIRKIYLWKHDDECIKEAEKEIAETNSRLNAAWQERHNSIDFDKALGLSSEERKSIRDKALAEIDDDWEKEIDAKYRNMVEGKN